MNKLLLMICLISVLSCSKDDDQPENNNNNNNNNPPGSCGTYNGYKLYKDAGGCYYTDYGSKVYVAVNLCGC